MKKIFLSTLCVCLSFLLKAQPSPLPPPVLELGPARSFTMENGLTVTLIENRTLPVVSFYLETDNRQYLEGNIKGVSDLTAEMLLMGSSNFTRTQLADTLANMGSQYKTTRSSIYISGLSKYSRANISLLAEMVIRPTFPLGEFERVKKDFSERYKSGSESPDFTLNRVFRRLAFSERCPFGELITPQTIGNIRLADCQDYYSAHWRPNQAILLVMGDISLDELKRLCNLRLRGWQAKTAPAKENHKAFDLPAAMVDFIHRAGEPSAGIIISNLAELDYKSEDIYPVIYLNYLMGGNFMDYFTNDFSGERQSLFSHYPFALLPDSNTGHMYLHGKTNPQDIISELQSKTDFLEKYRKDEISIEQLNRAKRSIGGSFALSMENRSLIGTCAAAAKTGILETDFLQTMLARLDTVSPAGIKRVAEKYIKPGQFRMVVYGDARIIAPELELAGYNINFYDENAVQIKRPSLAAPVEDGTTALKVIEKYIDALGGYGRLNSLKTLRQVFKVTKDDGETLESEIIQKAPVSIVEYIKSGGEIYMKRVYNGNMGYTKIGGSRKDLSMAEVEKRLNTRTLFPVLDYNKPGLIKAELDSIVPVKGRFTYKLNVELNDGTMQSYYISDKTFLPLRIDVISRKERSEFGEDGSLTGYTPEEISSSSLYYDYRSVFGIRYPHRIENNQDAAGSTVYELELVLPDIKTDNKTFR